MESDRRGRLHGRRSHRFRRWQPGAQHAPASLRERAGHHVCQGFRSERIRRADRILLQRRGELSPRAAPRSHQSPSLPRGALSHLRGLRPADRCRHLPARGIGRCGAQAGVYVRHDTGAEQRRRFVHAGAAAARSATGPGLRHSGRRFRRGRRARPATGREFRRRQAGDRPDERRLRPVIAWRRRGEGGIHTGSDIGERIPRAWTGPRHPAYQYPAGLLVRRDPERRPPAHLPRHAREAGVSASS